MRGMWICDSCTNARHAASLRARLPRMIAAVVERASGEERCSTSVLMRGDAGLKVVEKSGRAEMSERRWISVVRRFVS